MEILKEINSIKELFDFQILNYIAQGSFGKVYYALEKKTNKEVAIKVTDISSSNFETLYKEATILSELNHPNIVKFLKVIRSPKKLFLIMEYVRNGSLNELLEERKICNQRLTDYDISSIIKAIINAVRYLHEHGIVHRDLKLENILIQDKTDMTSIKLIDFGLSDKFQNENKILSKFCGTTLFQAPELINYQIYSKPVDIWSCGIILYMLCNEGRHPFYEGHEEKKEFYEKLLSPLVNFPLDFEELPKNLFMKMTAVEPSDRHTAEMVLNHPWITRKFHSSIPMTCSENLKAFTQQRNILTNVKTIFFMMFCKKKVKENVANFFNKKKKALFIQVDCEEFVSNVNTSENNIYSNQPISNKNSPELKINTPDQKNHNFKPFRIVSKSNSPIKLNRDLLTFITKPDEKIKESPKETINHTLKMHQEKIDIKEKDFTKGTINQFLKTQYISTEGSENWRFRQKEDKNLFSIKNSLNNSKSPEKKNLKKSLDFFQQDAKIRKKSLPAKSNNNFQIKHYKLQINDSSKINKKTKDEEKIVLEEKEKEKKSEEFQKKNPPNFKNKNPSFSPQLHPHKNCPITSKKEGKYRSMSIFTEVNQDNNENILKNEELMLKFLQPMHCDNLNKAKQFTELKGFFNSLIILSPTKTLSKASESLHIKNISLKNRRKI